MSLSIGILGLGKYGRSLAENMYKFGADVLVADKDQARIDEISTKVNSAVVADLASEAELNELGLGNLDIVVVAMGSNLEASILSVAIAKEKGVGFVIAKTSSDRMTAILEKIGVDKIVDPEEESGLRTARIIASGRIMDYIDMEGNLCMVEIKPKNKWIDHTIKDLDIRRTDKINIVAMRTGKGNWVFPDPNTVITSSTSLMAVLDKKDLKTIQ
ncbi:MAG: TrkA family potassium uptake protein [Clostridiales bacterium]|nr:TrkA family potassium uptake protein [Clostridiales bacterium]